MGSLQDFLNANAVDGLETEFILSERLKDYKFKIRTIPSKVLGELTKKCTYINSKGIPVIDEFKLGTECVIYATIHPDFKDDKSIKMFGCNTPAEYIDKVLLYGEHKDLLSKITEFSGLNKSLYEETEEVKKH